MPKGPKNRIYQEISYAERDYAWLAKKMQERGYYTTPSTVRNWAINYSQPSVGQAAVISDILKVPIYRLVQRNRNQSFQDELAKDPITIEKLDAKFKKD